MRDIEVGTNLILKANVLKAKSALDHSFGAITLASNDVDNVDLLLETGETNEDKSIIRISFTANSKINGIKAGYDGQSIWLYPQNITLEIKANNSLTAGYSIELSGKMKVAIYEMMNIVYDGTRGIWVIMNHHL